MKHSTKVAIESSLMLVYFAGMIWCAINKDIPFTIVFAALYIRGEKL